VTGRLHLSGDVPPRPTHVLLRGDCVLASCRTLAHTGLVSIEQIADLVGHRTTIVTQRVYRHQLKPVISTGATAMNAIFNKKSA
jgi:hypothetical protein